MIQWACYDSLDPIKRMSTESNIGINRYMTWTDRNLTFALLTALFTAWSRRIVCLPDVWFWALLKPSKLLTWTWIFDLLLTLALMVVDFGKHDRIFDISNLSSAPTPPFLATDAWTQNIYKKVSKQFMVPHFQLSGIST